MSMGAHLPVQELALAAWREGPWRWSLHGEMSQSLARLAVRHGWSILEANA
ncbi:hypothetical protein [Alicyclobacillus fructus]|uniref:hypothetical protein n=1 Tax=Alicyclobacillus fructus TaxID=2816082 RepID=UPI001A8E4A5B|nr:hypothetical protein [Alicyclobacillus fructus]